MASRRFKLASNPPFAVFFELMAIPSYALVAFRKKCKTLVALGTYVSHRLVAANSPHQSSGAHK